MKPLSWETAIASLIYVFPAVEALGKNDAEDMYNAFNNVFLNRNEHGVYYVSGLDKRDENQNWEDRIDVSWPAALDIMGVEDAYERTGDPDKGELVNDLLTTFLDYSVRIPWYDAYWNDDMGWFALALIRGYQITTNERYLDAAKHTFDHAFERGWNTKYNDGGIWENTPAEDPPEVLKEALSNDSLGKAACYLYQSTHDQNYYDKCRQIYDWVWDHVYDPNTGAIYRGVSYTGEVDHATAAYNQGTWLDYANLVWKITGDKNVYRDAENSIEFGRQKLTQNGIFSNGDTHLNTWADEMARGVGNFVRDNRQWGKYYSWMVDNANAILKNRRPDLGITWNAWAEPTSQSENSLITNAFVSAVAWLQYTPSSLPSEVGGIHTITNAKTGLAIDSGWTFGNGESIIQWGVNNGINQRWHLTQNSDDTWNILSMSTWKAIDCPNSSKDDGAAMDQWQSHRGANQRWYIEKQSDGTYKITNKDSGKVLDGGSSNTNGGLLVQRGWNGQAQQRWNLK